jgi:hypothetical protein
MVSCSNCAKRCPANDYPCLIWLMHSDEIPEEQIAEDCYKYEEEEA